MSSTELEIIENGRNVAPAQPTTLFRTDQPDEIVARATDVANVLGKVVKRKKLTVSIQGRDHVKVEGWCLLGTMLGVFPICVWTRKTDDGWEARVEARTLAGQVVGAAEASCTRGERTWANRDDYALRSMAQTRATSKALRQPLGFVMTLAGFDATPAEEMTAIVVEQAPKPARAKTVFEPPASARPATPEQFKQVNALIQDLTQGGVIDPQALADGMVAAYGTSVVSELTEGQASDFTKRLQAKLGEQP